MKHYADAIGEPRLFRDAHIIGDIAIVEAQRREEAFERSGTIYMLGEILTALHRQAEAMEAIECAITDVVLALPDQNLTT